MFVYCPECESTEIDTADDGSFECADCGHVFEDQFTAPIESSGDYDPAIDGLT